MCCTSLTPSRVFFSSRSEANGADRARLSTAMAIEEPRTHETTAPAPTKNKRLLEWVEEVASLTEPEAIHWCDGSAEEYEPLCAQLVEAGTFDRLSDAKRPSSYLACSDPGDVARVEDRTFICSATEEDAGPTNNWRDPDEMRESSPRCSRARCAGARCTSCRSRWGRWARTRATSACSSPTRPMWR